MLGQLIFGYITNSISSSGNYQTIKQLKKKGYGDIPN